MELAAHYQEQIKGRRAVISFQTAEEFWFGAYKAGWGDARKNRLAKHLDQYRVIESSPELVQISAQLRCDQEAIGRSEACNY